MAVNVHTITNTTIEKIDDRAINDHILTHQETEAIAGGRRTRRKWRKGDIILDGCGQCDITIETTAKSTLLGNFYLLQ